MGGNCNALSCRAVGTRRFGADSRRVAPVLRIRRPASLPISAHEPNLLYFAQAILSRVRFASFKVPDRSFFAVRDSLLTSRISRLNSQRNQLSHPRRAESLQNEYRTFE